MEDTLISLVQNYEELYNLKHHDYSNQQRRDNIWEEIGNIMKLPDTTCREKWQRIRENFRKALNIRKCKSGQSADRLKPPKYFQELSFLIPYLNDEENRRSNILRTGSRLDTRSPDLSLGSPERDSQISGSSSSNILKSTPLTCQKRRFAPYRPPINNQPTTATTVLQEYLSKTSTYSGSSPPTSDPLIDFFMTMAKTVKGFPIIKQLQIKADLFNMVHNVEVEISNEDASGTSTAPARGVSQEISLIQSVPQSNDSNLSVDSNSIEFELTDEFLLFKK